MRIKLATGAACLYLLASIITFGNAVVFFEARGEIRKAECEARTEKKNQAVCGWYESDGIAAIFSAAAWPFYWSYRLAL